MDFFNDLYNNIMTLIASSSFYGPLLACLLIVLESIIPILPLFVFISIVFIAYGYVFGFLIAYILTIVGCIISFILVRKLLTKHFDRKLRKKMKIDKLMKKIDKMKLSTLSLIIAIPFTPAFLINICAALSKMEFKKYFYSLLIGKISLVFFWGFIGTSLLESLKNPKILIIIVIMLILAYIISRIVTKKLDID